MGRLMNKDAVKIILESYDSGNLTQDALIDTIAYAQQDKVDKAVAKAIAARDKWWVEQIEGNCGYDKNGAIFMPIEVWQSLKQSLQPSVDKLQELPLEYEGKFPDLPDKWGEIQ